MYSLCALFVNEKYTVAKDSVTQVARILVNTLVAVVDVDGVDFNTSSSGWHPGEGAGIT